MPCPSDVEIAELLEGLATDERREAIETHLDGCEDCRQLLAALIDTVAAAKSPTIGSDDLGDFGELDVGATVGRYEVTRRIGAGGMGRVFGAHDPHLDREVAIKVLHARALTDESRRRLRSEARALARLAHPNVVSVYSVEHCRGRELVVMELVEGESLAAWQRRRPPWREVVAAYLQAGRGLAAAHARGLVHRDFKPDNCIRDSTGRVRVLDFGLARDLGNPSTDSIPMPHGDLELGSGDQAPHTRTGTILGTVAYMPLEQLRGERVDARSDQWSFCASLFEAVVGERPYRLGRSLWEQGSILGSARPSSRWPRGVPRSLWRILERGLATSPEERWPSLDALLGELERSVTPTRRWRLLSFGGLAAAALLAWRGAAPSSASCIPAADRLEGVWDDAARDRARLGLVGTAVPYAEDTWRRLGPRLDDYAERWAVADAWACEQARSVRSAPPPDLEVRLACLEDRRRRLRALASVLASADPTTVEHAANAVGALPSIRSCDGAKPGAALDLAPHDPRLASRLEALRQRLAEAEALTLAGRFDEALERARSLHDDAAALGFEPFGVEVDLLWGRLSGETGHYEDAVARLEGAFHRAVRAGREDVATDAALVLVHVMGQELGEHDDALGWARHARAHAERLEDDEHLAEVDRRLAGIELRLGHPERALELYRSSARRLAELVGPDAPGSLDALHGVANSHLELGELEQAREVAKRILHLERARLGPEHPVVATRLHLLASIHHQLGDAERAAELLHDVITIRVRALGPDHPHVGHARGNLGLLMLQLGKTDAAEQLLEQVLRTSIETLGPDHDAVADTLKNLAFIDLELGRLDSAERRLRRARSIYESTVGPEHRMLAETLEALAHTLAARGDPSAARDLQQRALATARAAQGPEHPDIANYLSNLGVAHARLDEHEQAIAQFSEAVTLLEATVGPDHPNLAFALTGIGSARLALGDTDGARRPLERALRIREQHAVAPGKRALTRFALARALDSSDRPTACEQARVARKEYGEADGDRREQVEEIEAWLIRCAAPDPARAIVVQPP